MSEYIIAFVISLVAALSLTPLIIRLAKVLNATDVPEDRKIHAYVMPRLGGLSIFAGVAAGLLYLRPPYIEEVLPFTVGACLIILVGILDDCFNIRPLAKLTGQVVAASVVAFSGILIDSLTIPFIGFVEFQFLSIPLTIIWIVAITNAVNLIDGLDGLATGTSIISLSSLLVVALMQDQVLAAMLAVIYIGASLGFLVFNFYPAKIFMGDSGSLFLGYSIAVISIIGLLKNLTIFTMFVPVIILAIPILDTLLAISRRMHTGIGLMTADKLHFHYRLLQMGFSHRGAVLIIYMLSSVFGFAAIVFSSNSIWLSVILGLLVLISMQLIIEVTDYKNRRHPLMDLFKRHE